MLWHIVATIINASVIPVVINVDVMCVCLCVCVRTNSCLIKEKENEGDVECYLMILSKEMAY